MRALHTVSAVVVFLALIFFPDVASAQAPGAKPPNMFFSRMFSQAFVYALPVGWKLLHEGASADGLTYSLGYGRDDVSPENWTELITVTGFKDMGKDPKASPSGLVEHMARQKRGICPERAVAISGGDVLIGSRRANIAVVGCGKLPVDAAGMKAGEGEISFHIVMQGDSDMYVITRLQRVAAFEPQSQPVTPEVYGELVRSFLPIGVCELKDSEFQCRPKLAGRK
jgi:hypothetical protein